MSLQSNINTWKGIYDNTGINAGGGDPSYIGSVVGVNGNTYVGPAIYTGVGNKIHDFNVYAGQGVTLGNSTGGKFLLESTGGFSWDTVPSGSAYAMQTSGSLNNLYLGTSADSGKSPEEFTVAEFAADKPLLVIQGFNIVSDYAATLFGGSNGNSSIALSQAGTGAATGITFGDLMAKANLYASATFNSAVNYNLAFEENALGVSTFEWALDKYLESKGSDITDSWANIDAALAGTGVSVDYYPEADDYAPGGIVASAAAELESDLLLAA
ncbi:TPA: hypothetical protein OT834_002917 [Morganella morganii]|nr:hypothetical protein [Morganella morganii]